jgi:hypothetical protein
MPSSGGNRPGPTIDNPAHLSYWKQREADQRRLDAEVEQAIADVRTVWPIPGIDAPPPAARQEAPDGD